MLRRRVGHLWVPNWVQPLPVRHMRLRVLADVRNTLRWMPEHQLVRLLQHLGAQQLLRAQLQQPPQELLPEGLERRLLNRSHDPLPQVLLQ
jgi:hypothetical protein